MKKICALIALEWGRLLKRPSVRLILFLTVCSPAFGLFLYCPATADTMLSRYLANPALAGGVGGGILFGLLTIRERGREKRCGVNTLIDGIIPPSSMAFIRTAALFLTAFSVLLGTMAFWLPVSRFLIGSVFDIRDFLLSYVLFMGSAIFLAVLASASAFQIGGRADLALALFGIFAGLSLTLWSENWQLCWLNPCVWALSDDFSNLRIFRSAAYMRLTWAAGLAGLWLLSCPAVRRRRRIPFLSKIPSQAGTGFSVRRQVLRPAAALILFLISACAWAGQPFVDHSNPDQSVSAFDQIPLEQGLTCSRRLVRLSPDTKRGTVTGTAVYQFQNTSGKPRTAAFGINPGYTIFSARVNGVPVPASVRNYQEFNEALLEVTLPGDSQMELTLEYGGFPREDQSLSTMQGSAEISGEYLYLANADLSPRLINAEPDSGVLPVTVEITLPEHMTVIPFGSPQAEIISQNLGGTLTWQYEDEGTGGILYAGDYIRQDIEAAGITVEFYYGRNHETVMEEAGAANAIRAVIQYCTDRYGPLSFLSGNTLKLIQSRVSGGGYAGGGASLLDEADFTIASLRDTSKGSVPGEVMIHELVHQWWGLSSMFEADGAWSAEGLTVYTTYRIVKELYGAEYAERRYVDQWKREMEDYYSNFYVRNPEFFQRLPEAKRLEITNRLSRVRQYCEMPLKILKAEQLAGGETAMDQILSRLFCREPSWEEPYLTYEMFLNACGLTEEDINLE